MLPTSTIVVAKRFIFVARETRLSPVDRTLHHQKSAWQTLPRAWLNDIRSAVTSQCSRGTVPVGGTLKLASDHAVNRIVRSHSLAVGTEANTAYRAVSWQCFTSHPARARCGNFLIRYRGLTLGELDETARAHDCGVILG